METKTNKPQTKKFSFGSFKAMFGIDALLRKLSKPSGKGNPFANRDSYQNKSRSGLQNRKNSHRVGVPGTHSRKRLPKPFKPVM